MIKEDAVISRLSFHVEQLRANGLRSEKGKQSVAVMKELLMLIDEPTHESLAYGVQDIPKAVETQQELLKKLTNHQEENSSGSLLDF